VKDIRLISDKITGEIRDYAFVDYFSIEEATNAINNIKRNPIKLRNNPIFVTFSKIKRTDEVKVSFLIKYRIQ
jgi:RNA recognition motif-containing protein